LGKINTFWGKKIKKFGKINKKFGKNKKCLEN
jgi:hypothetical protein